MAYYEVNFDGLVGPSHNFSGLASGNLASDSHRGNRSYPRQAALQGLEKMWQLHQLGFIQGVIPPACRPDLITLRNLGFKGDDCQVLSRAYTVAPQLLAACYSAASMWAANAATVTASIDSIDGRVQFTPANLITTFHRSLEPRHTAHTLQRIFSDERYFCHHSPLPSQTLFADEGAANHTRLCASHGQPGITMMVYGRTENSIGPLVYPARQSRTASATVARQHGIDESQLVLVQQNPEVIDQGVFHHDVIGVGQGNFLMLHEHAVLDQRLVKSKLQQLWQNLYPDSERALYIAEVPDSLMTVREAVDCYLFNSQLLSRDDGSMVLLAPHGCQFSEPAQRTINWLLQEENPLTEVIYADVSQSLNNGGGPACLRLRVPMNDQELAAVHPGVILDDKLYNRLTDWILRNYREHISEGDLADPDLHREILTALDELTEIILLPSLYPFQA